jgi:heme a synthase
MPYPPSVSPAGLRCVAFLTAVATLCLVGLGGLVTSHGVGMAVPDWPNTYGYNMFFFPVSQWVGGIFYEHTHRLLASGVGLLTTILALWLYGTSARRFMRWAGIVLFALGMGLVFVVAGRWTDGLVLGITGLALFGASFVWPRCDPAAKWLRRLGLAAFFAVVLQGVLGGLRVVLYKDAIGIFHATLAQLFFVLVCAIALFTSRWWQRETAGDDAQPDALQFQNLGKLRWLFIATSALILGQLMLGAEMRHQHAGLAIPDFPLAYGKLWPATDPGSVAVYNQRRIEVLSANPITALQIVLQMIHRMMALFILLAVAFCAWSTRRARVTDQLASATGQWSADISVRQCTPRGVADKNVRAPLQSTEPFCARPAKNILGRLTLVWLGLIVTQVLLGAATIWSDKAADLATAHVLVGALSLAVGVIVSIITSHKLVLTRRVIDSGLAAEAQTELPLQPRSGFGISSHAT